MFKEFRDLRRKPERLLGLPDLFNYAFAEDEYTIMTKDGARLRAFECHGPDLNSASPAELDAHRALTNRAFTRFDEGVVSVNWWKSSWHQPSMSERLTI